MRYLTEIQRFRDNTYIFGGIMVILCLPLILMVSPLALDKVMETGEWVGLGFSLLSLLLCALLLTTMNTYLRMEPDRIIYRSNPFVLNRKTIQFDEIAEWSIANHRWVHGLGYRITMGGGWVYVMKPGKALAITTKDGRNYRFGINRPALVERFMEEHREQKERSYGE